MAAVTWIQMSSFLLLMLQVKAATTGNTLSSFTVRAGHDTSLSCENVIDGQQNCNSTTWIFISSTRGTVELVVHGQIKENAEAKSDRLSVAVNCSLVIKKVTDDDVSRYTCRQFRTRGGQQEGGDAVIDLSVIHMTERENNDEVILSCSVWTHEPCSHTVQWLFEGKENMKVKAGSCSDTVTFTRSQLNQKSQFYESLKCKVTHDHTNNEQLFPFKLKSSGEDAKTTTTTSPPTTTTTTTSPPPPTTTTTTSTAATSNTESPTSTFKPPSEEGKTSGYLWLISLPVALAALLMIVVSIKCKKIKENETQLGGNIGLNFNPAETESGPGTNQDTAEADDDFSYASINFTKKMKNKARSRGDDDGDTVTYSTVKASSSSGGAPAAPSDLYSTIDYTKTLKKEDVSHERL